MRQLTSAPHTQSLSVPRRRFWNPKACLVLPRLPLLYSNPRIQMAQRRESLRAYGSVLRDPFRRSGGIHGNSEIKQPIHTVEIDGTKRGVLTEWTVPSGQLPGVADCNTRVFDALEDLEEVAVWGCSGEGSVGSIFGGESECLGCWTGCCIDDCQERGRKMAERKSWGYITGEFRLYDFEKPVRGGKNGTADSHFDKSEHFPCLLYE